MTTQTTKTRGYLMLSLLALFGCSLEVAEGESVATTKEELVLNPTAYTWTQGEPTRYMVTIDKNICFLNRVGGNFAGSGEKVFISTAAGSPGSPGVWTLGGSSFQTGVHAWARCVGGLQPTDIMYQEKIWQQGNPPTVLASATGWACFLTRMEGRFRSTSELLRIRQLNGNWVLDGTSQQAGVVGGARCFRVVDNREDEVEWNTGWGTRSMGQTLNGFRSCHLTRVSGLFNGGGAYVRVYQANDGWFINGAGNPMNVRGRCVL